MSAPMLSMTFTPVPAGTVIGMIVVSGASLSMSMMTVVGMVIATFCGTPVVALSKVSVSAKIVGVLFGPPLLLVNRVVILPPLLFSPARPGVNTVFDWTYGPKFWSYRLSLMLSSVENVAP